MSFDGRIGGAFSEPGPGWGGSCLPKDTAALVLSARQAGVDPALLTAAVEANAHQRDRVVAKVRAAAATSGSLDGLRVGLLGLTFKAGTDGLRHSLRDAVGPVQVVADPYLVAKGGACVGTGAPS